MKSQMECVYQGVYCTITTKTSASAMPWNQWELPALERYTYTPGIVVFILDNIQYPLYTHTHSTTWCTLSCVVRGHN